MLSYGWTWPCWVGPVGDVLGTREVVLARVRAEGHVLGHLFVKRGTVPLSCVSVGAEAAPLLLLWCLGSPAASWAPWFLGYASVA